MKMQPCFLLHYKKHFVFDEVQNSIVLINGQKHIQILKNRLLWITKLKHIFNLFLILSLHNHQYMTLKNLEF
jgi:hypothetical protein